MAKRKIRVLKHLPGVYSKYQPEVGKVYEADYTPHRRVYTNFSCATCIINILDKRICLREDEYEVLED